MSAEQTVQTVAAFTVIGSVLFVLLMWFNIASLMKYLRRDKTEEADEKKQHSGLFWAVDGILTFLFSLDFLTLFIIFI